mmetsp:Transcript_28085/g.42481  ORF Transcript_28085/g.42481 Transcript_28085/m.42481 type:complete len:96 (+) Transcript_28085:320-607(+)
MPHQTKIFDDIIKQWEEEPEIGGSIVFMPTGTGKTLIAVMVILYVFKKYTSGDQVVQLYTEDDFRKERDPKMPHKKVLMLVPTQNLVDQQSRFIQ